MSATNTTTTQPMARTDSPRPLPTIPSGGDSAGRGKARLELNRRFNSVAAKTPSECEELFAQQARVYGLPKCEREVKFAQKRMGRRWKFDFAFPEYWLAVEIEGISMRKDREGRWQMGGRHASIQGFKDDCIKYDTAILLGWSVLRFEQSMVKSRIALNLTMRVLASRGWEPIT